ncbi:MAG: hypothetical protein FJ144_12950 [Deltaproteobacteria bacterium]|nr:hypothetical protein [Deltaproteobacteria bacterium]
MAFLSPLGDEQRTTFLVVSLSQRTLLRLVGALGTAPKGSRLDRMSIWELARTLVDFYGNDAEVAAEVDRALEREIGISPLAPAAATLEGATALSDLVLTSRDPLRDLAWALLSAGGDASEAARTRAAEAIQAIITEYDDAEARARAEEEQRKNAEPDAAPAEPDPEEIARRVEKETASAKRGRERALKRVDDMRSRLVELEESLAAARKEVRTERTGRVEAEAAASRLAGERDEARSRLQARTSGEVQRLKDLIEDERERRRTAEEDLDEARDAEARASARLRELEERRAAPGEAGGEAARADPASTATWSLPVFTGEFYDSIRSWDRKVLRTAFDKIVRLAEDWRHPSLRAIPLEGLPGHYRIRIASDVRLIYRLLDGGRIEILSLIDREDLQRYIRTAKTR